MGKYCFRRLWSLICMPLLGSPLIRSRGSEGPISTCMGDSLLDLSTTRFCRAVEKIQHRARALNARALLLRLVNGSGVIPGKYMLVFAGFDPASIHKSQQERS